MNIWQIQSYLTAELSLTSSQSAVKCFWQHHDLHHWYVPIKTYTLTVCAFSLSVHVASKNKNARYWIINNWQGCCRIRKTSDFYKVKGSCKHPVGGYVFLLLTLWEAVLNPGHASIKTYSHSEYLTFFFHLNVIPALFKIQYSPPKAVLCVYLNFEL